MSEPHYVLAVFHQAGRDERIAKGVDGQRDYFTKAELQLACWRLMQGERRPQVGFQHQDGTTGLGQVVESFLWPEEAPDWATTGVDGTEVLVKSGDWLGKVLLDDRAHQMVENGWVTGVSLQGVAKRRKARP